VTFSLTYKGFDYVAFYNGAYENSDSLPTLVQTGANSIEVTLDYGIDAQTSQVVTDPNYTDSLTALGQTIAAAEADGLSVMVRPLIDFLNASESAPYSVGEWRQDYQPSNVASFFASYQTMIVQEAEVAQANGAQMLSIGAELDQLTGTQYLSYWTSIIDAVRQVFTGQLTYSASWSTAGDVSFWNQLDYEGIDNYIPLSNAKNPTVADLVNGWLQPATATSNPGAYAVIGNQSPIQYFENLSAASGKPLLFTEIGYANDSGAAADPSAEENSPDPTLQADLYQAFFQAWSESGSSALKGAYFWEWDPNGSTSNVGPTEDTFSPQNSPAQTVVTDEFTEGIACYCAGTLIAVDRGDVPVEALRIGDRVVTASGLARPIKWIGRRSYNGRFAMGQKHILPICIKAGAIDAAVPRRDLWISPHHAVYLDGVLIEARDLLNGISVVQAETCAKIEYFHIELETHDVIVAEGAPSETFIDDDSRGIFHNAHEYRALYPNAVAGAVAASARYCASRLTDGYQVETVRRRMAQRAGLLPDRTTERIGAMRGYIDLIAPGCISGWAQNLDHPDAPVCLDIYAGDKLIGQVLANRYRDDLKRAGIGSGHHAFEFKTLSGSSFAPSSVAVHRSFDGTALLASAEARKLAARHLA
jgi:hypothetical protein